MKNVGIVLPNPRPEQRPKKDIKPRQTACREKAEGCRSQAEKSWMNNHLAPLFANTCGAWMQISTGSRVQNWSCKQIAIFIQISAPSPWSPLPHHSLPTQGRVDIWGSTCQAGSWRGESPLSKLWVPLELSGGLEDNAQEPGRLRLLNSQGWGHGLGCLQKLLRWFECEAKTEHLCSGTWNDCGV